MIGRNRDRVLNIASVTFLREGGERGRGSEVQLKHFREKKTKRVPSGDEKQRNINTRPWTRFPKKKKKYERRRAKTYKTIHSYARLIRIARRVSDTSDDESSSRYFLEVCIVLECMCVAEMGSCNGIRCKANMQLFGETASGCQPVFLIACCLFA